MENESLLAIKHIKEVSKKKVTIAKIESFARKNKIDISTDKLKKIVENMVSDGVIQKQGEKQDISYYFPEQSDNSIEVVSDTQEVSSEETVDSTQVEDTRQESVTPDADNNKETETMLSVLKDLDSLKSFQETVEKKLFDLEKALISNQTTPSNNSVCNSGTSDENGTLDFILNILKNRITNLENEISKKDAIIDHLMSQLLLSKNASHNDNNSDDEKKNGEFNNKRKSSYTNQDSAKEKREKIVITADSMLKGIHERGLSKQQQVKIQNFPGGTSETILDVVDTLVTDKPDCIIVHAGTNDITKGINSLNSVKKIVKKVKQTSPNTKVVFSSLITRKDKKDLDKQVQDINNRLKNYCMQTNLDYIQNNNIKEEHLGNKKLRLNKKGNTVFSSNLLKYLRAAF